MRVQVGQHPTNLRWKSVNRLRLAHPESGRSGEASFTAIQCKHCAGTTGSKSCMNSTQASVSIGSSASASRGSGTTCRAAFRPRSSSADCRRPASLPSRARTRRCAGASCRPSRSFDEPGGPELRRRLAGRRGQLKSLRLFDLVAAARVANIRRVRANRAGAGRNARSSVTTLAVGGVDVTPGEHGRPAGVRMLSPSRRRCRARRRGSSAIVRGGGAVSVRSACSDQRSVQTPWTTPEAIKMPTGAGDDDDALH